MPERVLDGSDRIDVDDAKAATRPSGDRVAIFAPALVLHVEIHDTSTEHPEVHLHAGGQGYWVARMVDTLGCRPVPCGVVGGEPGEALRAIVAADGLESWLSTSALPSAVYIDDRRDGDNVRIVETPIQALGRHEIDELYSGTIGAAIACGVCVIAGTQLAPILPPSVLARLVGDLRRNDVTVVADVCGDLLEAVLEPGVDVVKLSHEELIRDRWATGDDVVSVVRGIRRLQRRGVRRVVVSRGDRSTIAADGDVVAESVAPRLEVVDGRGGGDSMTAALAVAERRGLDLDDALRLATSAAALNVSRHGLGTGRRDAIESLASRVEVRPIGTAGRLSRSARYSDVDQLTRDDLRALAAELGIRGRSRMSKPALIDAVRAAGHGATPDAGDRIGTDDRSS
jgi:1-phosphofructokinase